MPRTTFFFDDPMGRNTVQVLSRALLETITVRTNELTGEIELDSDNVVDQAKMSFEVPVESLDTGIPLMNEVLRSDRWLDAAKYPKIRFALGRVLAPAVRTALADGATIEVTGEGTFELHGVSRPVSVRAEVTWHKGNENTARRLPGDLLRVVARFDVHLPTFGIESHLSPQTLGKVSETLKVEVDLFASTQRPQVPDTMLQNLARARKELGQRLASA